MAISIKVQPQVFQPVYNPIILVLDSDNKTQTNFQYIVDINVSGTTTSRLKMSSNLDGYGVVDLHKHIEPYITYDLDHTNLETFQLMNNSFVPYSVTLSEEYITSGVTTIYTGTTVMTGETYAINSVESWVDFRTFDYTDYNLDYTNPGKLISSINTEVTVKENDRLWVNIFNNVIDGSKFLRIETSNSEEFLILNSGYTSISGETKFLSVGVGPWNITNTTSVITPVTGSTYPIIKTTTEWYDISMAESGGDSTSVKKRIYLDKNVNCIYDNYNLIYRDKQGSYLSFNFELASKLNKTIQRKTFQKNFGSYNSTTNTWGYNTYDRGKTHLDSTINDKYMITSNWVSEDEGDRVINLFESPDVYHLVGSDSITYIASGATKDINSFSNNGGLLQVNLSTTGYSHTVGSYVIFSNCTPEINGKTFQVTSLDDSDSFTIYTPYVNYPFTGTDAIGAAVLNIRTYPELYAINIDTNSLEVKQKSTSTIINYQLGFEYAFNNPTQK